MQVGRSLYLLGKHKAANDVYEEAHRIGTSSLVSFDRDAPTGGFVWQPLFASTPAVPQATGEEAAAVSQALRVEEILSGRVWGGAAGADDWEIWHNKGLCNMYLRQYDTAADQFRRANAIQRHDATFMQLGKVRSPR
jgi:hypothetical protein